jgi:hypothetical protein
MYSCQKCHRPPSNFTSLDRCDVVQVTTFRERHLPIWESKLSSTFLPPLVSRIYIVGPYRGIFFKWSSVINLIKGIMEGSRRVGAFFLNSVLYHVTGHLRV